MTFDIADLSAEFPREAISWRAQTLTKDGSKAMALAYIDARDVMGRLDEVCGPENWQDSYVETPKGRVIATIEIWIGDRWVSKSDGAGETDIEGDKGGISDAFKRAAVKWGIGRYLYALDAPWVPCESYETEYQGRKKWNWRSWKTSPWDYVNGNTPAVPKKDGREIYSRLSKANKESADLSEFDKLWSHPATQKAFDGLPKDWRQKLADEKADKFAELDERAAIQSDGATPEIPPNFDNMDNSPAP